MKEEPVEHHVSKKQINDELEASSMKYHLIAAWVAIVFDPVFAITDYINIPHGWLGLFFIRLTVSAITLSVVLVRKKYNIPSYIIVIVPFVLISVQNAYTYSLTDTEHLLGHSLNYIALFIGAAMFMLWPALYSMGMVGISILATAFFVSLNPAFSWNEFFLHGGLLLLMVAVFMVVLIKTRYDLSRKEIVARLKLKYSNQALSEQKEIVTQANEKITQSIKYAQRIQQAILGSTRMLQDKFTNGFILFHPRDIVSGDFYYVFSDEVSKVRIVVASDCTGHGVPAALMTVMGVDFLRDIIEHKQIYSPEKILAELDAKIVASLKSTAGSSEVKDGMDISVLTFRGENEVYFSSAMNPLCIVRNGEIERVKGSKYPIGGKSMGKPKEFELETFACNPGDKFYIFSDGFQDQFGGPDNRKYMTKRFRQFLLDTSSLSMEAQKERLSEEFLSWKGDKKQTDDMLIIGVEV